MLNVKQESCELFWSGSAKKSNPSPLRGRFNYKTTSRFILDRAG